MEIGKIIYLCVILSICAITDLKEKKIKNRWIAVGLAGLFFFLIWKCEVSALRESVSAMLFLFIIFFPLYFIRVMGAGDVKLICMTGMYIGKLGTGIFLLFTFLVAGVMAIIKLLYYGNTKKRMRYLINYFKIIFLTGNIEEYGIPKEKAETIGLGVPVLGGALGWYLWSYMIL